MATTNTRFVAKNGLDNNGTSIANLGTAGASLSLAGANSVTLTSNGPTNVTLPTSGTLLTAVTPANFSSQAANTVLAAPSGAAGVPTFRALVAADIPTLNQNTTGSAATVTAGTQSAITSVGTLTSLGVSGSITAGSITNTTMIGYTEQVTTIATTTAAQSLNLGSGSQFFSITLTSNITTLTLTNPPASGVVASYTLILKQDATGNRTVTWPTAFKWEGGNQPVLSTAANSVDIVTFFTISGGTTFYAFQAAKGML